jgi:hypothetical protein
MFSKLPKNSKKIDLSFITYLKEDDIEPNYVTMEQIKKRHPSAAKSNLDAFRLFLMVNYKVLSDYEKGEIQKSIDYLYKQEQEKYISAINYIDSCQENQQKSTQE